MLSLLLFLFSLLSVFLRPDFLGHIWVSEGLFYSKMHTYFCLKKIRVVSGLREGLTTDETGANALVNQHGTGANSLVNCMGLRANSLVN